jgi:hypothetical protein
MSDVGPYGYTDRASDLGVTANQLVGERAGLTTANASTPGISPAFLSTAPYNPNYGKEDRRFMCRGKNDTCRAYRVKGTDWCIFHTPKDDE